MLCRIRGEAPIEGKGFLSLFMYYFMSQSTWVSVVHLAKETTSLVHIQRTDLVVLHLVISLRRGTESSCNAQKQRCRSNAQPVALNGLERGPMSPGIDLAVQVTLLVA